MMRGKSQGSNSGIQANNVTSEVTAVGDNAFAQKTVGGDRDDIHKAIKELREAVSLAKIPTAARKQFEKQVGNLETEVRRRQPRKKQVQSSVREMKSTLDGVSSFLSDSATLIKPLKRIAHIVGVGLGALGLS